MPHLVIVLFKINLVLAFFSLAYYVILRRLTFYTINRAFLLVGILFSSLYPFIDLTAFFHNQQELGNSVITFNQQVSSLTPYQFLNDHILWIRVIFWTGVAIMATRFLFQLLSVWRLHRQSMPAQLQQQPVRLLPGDLGPFTFWQTIYINPSLHQPEELSNILAHERVHVKQWHTIDILLAELSVVFYWFNPGVWLMKKAVKENLEFITDERMLRAGINKKAYQYSLLDVSKLQVNSVLSSHFTLSDIRRRIQMMNSKRSSKILLSRYVLVLPALLIASLAFSVSGNLTAKDEQTSSAQLLPASITDQTPGVKDENAGTSKPAAAQVRTNQPAGTRQPRRSSTVPAAVNANNTTTGTKEQNSGLTNTTPSVFQPSPQLPIKVVEGVMIPDNDNQNPAADADKTLKNDRSNIIHTTGFPVNSNAAQSATKEVVVIGHPTPKKNTP